MGSSSAIKDSDGLIMKEFRLPWALRISFVAGIVIPVCMIIHSSDRQVQAMQESLQQEEKARMTIAGERDALAQVAARSTAQAMELTGKIKVIAGSKRSIEQQLKESGEWLVDERRMRSSLQDEVTRLSAQMTAFQKREGALQDIIQLLEGEVASVEKRLEKIKAQAPVARVKRNVSGGLQSTGSANPGNEHGGNADGSQDAQVIALLNELGIMNGEIEKVREERNILRKELDRLAAGRKADKVALRPSRKGTKGVVAGFDKDND